LHVVALFAASLSFRLCRAKRREPSSAVSPASAASKKTSVASDADHETGFGAGIVFSSEEQAEALRVFDSDDDEVELEIDRHGLFQPVADETLKRLQAMRPLFKETQAELSAHPGTHSASTRAVTRALFVYCRIVHCCFFCVASVFVEYLSCLLRS
jgi:hypothetical protein